MIRERTRIRAGGLPWYKSTSLLLNSVSPTIVHDYANNRYARYENTTNQSKYSQDFSDGSWAKTASSIASTNNLAPDGTLTASLLIEDTATSFHNLGKVTIGPPNIGDPITISCYFKPKERTQLRIQIASTIVSGTNYANFDTITGAVTTSGAITFTTFERITDNWWRASVTAIATAAGASGSNTLIMLNGGAGSYAGDGVSGMYFWGHQVEYSACMEGYVPTTSTSVTRVTPLASQTFPFRATRTSNGTMFDASGKIVWSPSNEILYSYNIASSSWASVSSSTTTGEIDPFGNPYACTYVENGAPATVRISSNITPAANRPNCISLYVKMVNTDILKLQIADANSVTKSAEAFYNLSTGVVVNTTTTGTGCAVISTAMSNVGGGWWRVSMCHTIDVATTMLKLRSSNPTFTANADIGSGVGIGTSFIFAAPQHEPMDASSPKAYNETRSTAVYGPRFGCNPSTGAALGLMSEEARTNTVTICDYTSGTAASTTLAGSSMLGRTTARTATADGTSAPHLLLGASTTPTGSTAYTVSCYARYKGSQRYVQLTVSSSHYADVTDYANYDLLTGTVTQVGATATASITPCVETGVYRLILTYTTAAVPGSGSPCVIYFIDNPTDTRAPTNTSTGSFDFMGVQVELGAFATSLIPTYGVAATRATDTYKIGVGSWLPAGNFTMYVNIFLPDAAQIPVLNRNTIAINRDANNTVNNFISTSGLGFQSIVGGASHSVTRTPIFTSPAQYKTASLANATNKTVTYNGAVPATTATPAYIGGNNVTLAIANNYTGSANILNGYITEFRFYPDATASNAQLQTLTT